MSVKGEESYRGYVVFEFQKYFQYGFEDKSQCSLNQYAIAHHMARMVGPETVSGTLILPTPPQGRGFPCLTAENYYYIDSALIYFYFTN